MVHLKKKNKPSPENIDALYLEASHPAFKEIFDNANDAMLAIHNDSVCSLLCEPQCLRDDRIQHQRTDEYGI